MFTSPKLYAKAMLNAFDTHELALVNLYEAAKAHPSIPNRFWFDCAEVLRRMELTKRTPKAVTAGSMQG